MSNTSATLATGETRQAMIRVWMAISAIWVAFWLSIAALIMVVNGATPNPLIEQFRLFVVIVMLPPVAFLAIGTLVRMAFEALFRRNRRSH